MPSSCFTPTGPSLDAPLPSTGFPRVRVPRLQRYYQGATTPRGPSRRASLSFAWRYHPCTHRSLPPAWRAAPMGRGSFAICAGCPCRIDGWRPRGLPRSCRTPIAPLPCSSTPAGSWTSGRYDATTRPPLKARRRLPRIPLSRLNHTASVLAVYASQCGLPQHHARLASGCRPALPGGRHGPQGSYGRFPICSSLHIILLPQTSWRKLRLALQCSPHPVTSFIIHHS